MSVRRRSRAVPADLRIGAMRDMLNYLLGPFLALLPTRWRKALPFYQSVPWHSAAILSGLAESVIALTALLFWYSYSVTSWVSRGLDSALSKTPPMDISVHDVGFAG